MPPFLAKNHDKILADYISKGDNDAVYATQHVHVMDS
jgi:hypothetical protein